MLQTDPIGYGDNMNVYAYVANNPLNQVDPDGLQAEEIPVPDPEPEPEQAPAAVLNPRAEGQDRGCDNAGCGHYGAPRGGNVHEGHDINADVGEDLIAPIDGTVRVITAVYANDGPDFEGVEINSTEQSAKIFYANPSVATGDEVSAGDVIGTTQDRAAASDRAMQSHVHLEIREGAERHRIDPAERLERN